MFLFFLASCSGANYDYLYTSGKVWGTDYNVTYKGSEHLADSVKVLLDSVGSSLSFFNAQSSLSLLNKQGYCAPDKMLAEVLLLSQKVNRDSRGAFDPSVGELVNLWGFGPEKGNILPDSVQVRMALRNCGIQRCVVSDRTVIIPQGMKLDFSAVAKGYAVDCIARMLRRNGVSNYMVEIGGELACAGNNPDGQKWRVMVETPGEQDKVLIASADSLCMASSGNYRRVLKDSSGVSYGHTISPVTGFPVVTNTMAVTVTAPDCATADALATACMAMPYADARKMIDSLAGVEAVFVLDTAAVVTGAFPLVKP
ncbi:MAG: FAD:protein FMN transferase [Muribaculaceae bacterium]|nr:FAD:protein FMN transferase [Muribaculaceae bacterium]